MKNKKVYVLTSSSGSDDYYYSSIVDIYSNNEDAHKAKQLFDETHLWENVKKTIKIDIELYDDLSDEFYDYLYDIQKIDDDNDTLLKEFLKQKILIMRNINNAIV